MIQNEVIWITGASSGIGKAMAIALAQHNRVIVSARNEQALRQLAETHPSMSVVPFDVTDHDSLNRVSEEILLVTEHLDRVILNAGTCEYLDIRSPQWSMLKEVMTANFFGMVNSVELALPFLKKAEKPHLIGIGSQAINAPFVRAEAYGASKAAVHYFLDSLRLDLARYSIDVTEIQPGFVDTPLTRRNDFAMPFLMTAEQAASRMLKAIERRPMRYAFPKRLSTVLFFARAFPTWWLNKNRHPEKINAKRTSANKETVK